MTARAGALVTVLALAALCGVARSEPLEIGARAVALQTEGEPLDRVGRLVYRGGLELTAADPRFGGLSGLAISDRGRRLYAVTDRGHWIFFFPVVSEAGRLVGIAGAQIGKLRDPAGNPLRRGRGTDAESLVRIEGGLAVAFEHRHRLWLYRGAPNPLDGRPTALPLPAGARGMSPNKGLEAAARLPDGRLMVIAEDFPADAAYARGWIFDAGRWRGFRYRRTGQFLPAGASALPGGGLLVLERRFSYIGGFGTRLVELAPGAVRPGAEISGREMARFERPLITDNFEGIASYRDGAGDTILYLVSDDNFNPLQGTYLLRFALER